MADLFTPVFQSLFSKFREQPRIGEVERSEEVPTSEYLWNRVIPKGYPVVFSRSGVIARSEAEVIEILSDKCSDLTIEVRRATFEAPNQYTTDRGLRTITVREYLQELHHCDAYAGNQKLPREVEAVFEIVPPCFGEGSMEPPAFWLGGKGCVTPLHKDSTDNFAYQICGSKRWILYPIRDIPFLYMDKPFAHTDFATSCIDPRNSGTREFPLFSNAKSVVVDVHAGELLYLPAGWSHYVENRSLSFMVNYWISPEFFARSMK